jgi:hypothetical protein
MTDPAPSFAIIAVPPDGKPPAGAIVHGPLDVVMERVLDSKARVAAEALVARADQAAEQEREREEREQEVITEGIRAIADGILKLKHRLDAIEHSRDARRKLDAASEATEQMLQLPKDVDPEAPYADPEAPADEAPVPGGELHAPVPAKDPSEHEPAAADQGNLPKELLKGAPPDPGSEPVEDPAELAHPQPPTRQPIAIEE